MAVRWMTQGMVTRFANSLWGVILNSSGLVKMPPTFAWRLLSKIFQFIRLPKSVFSHYTTNLSFTIFVQRTTFFFLGDQCAGEYSPLGGEGASSGRAKSKSDIKAGISPYEASGLNSWALSDGRNGRLSSVLSSQITREWQVAIGKWRDLTLWLTEWWNGCNRECNYGRDFQKKLLNTSEGN